MDLILNRLSEFLSGTDDSHSSFFCNVFSMMHLSAPDPTFVPRAVKIC